MTTSGSSISTPFHPTLNFSLHSPRPRIVSPPHPPSPPLPFSTSLHVDIANFHAAADGGQGQQQQQQQHDGVRAALSILKRSIRWLGGKFLSLTAQGYHLKMGGHYDGARESLLRALAADDALGNAQVACDV